MEQRPEQRPEQPVALITGASQGLGLAIAEALAARGWAIVIDARHADRLEAAAASLPTRASVTALAGDITDVHHRAPPGSRGREARPTRPAREQREHARRQPPSAARNDRPRCAATRVRGERDRTARLDPAPPRPSHEVGRHDREHHVRRSGRAVRAVGRLRLVEGRARTPHGDSRCRAPRPPCARRRSRRHADRDAPRRVPGRGHLGPTPAGDRRPSSRRAVRRATDQVVGIGWRRCRHDRSARLSRCRRHSTPTSKRVLPRKCGVAGGTT